MIGSVRMKQWRLREHCAYHQSGHLLCLLMLLTFLLWYSAKKGSKEGGRKKLTMAEIQKLAVDSTRDVDLDADGDDEDWDEDDLLAELEGAEEEAMNGVWCMCVCL